MLHHHCLPAPATFQALSNEQVIHKDLVTGDCAGTVCVLMVYTIFSPLFAIAYADRKVKMSIKL